MNTVDRKRPWGSPEWRPSASLGAAEGREGIKLEIIVLPSGMGSGNRVRLPEQTNYESQTPAQNLAGSQMPIQMK